MIHCDEHPDGQTDAPEWFVCRVWVCPMNGVSGVHLLEVLCCWHAVGEGDGERVQRGLPPHGPSCLAGALGVQSAGDQVQALQRGLLGGEVRLFLRAVGQ